MIQKRLKQTILSLLLAGTCLLGGCGGAASPGKAGETPSEEAASQQAGTGAGETGEAAGEAGSGAGAGTAGSSAGAGETALPEGLRAQYLVHTGAGEAQGALPISDTLYGIFLEDINYALDGGLYPELVKNRSFEYGSLAAGSGKHGWSIGNPQDESLTFEILEDAAEGLHENNPHFARLTNQSEEFLGIYNKGFLEGMSVTLGETYTLSLYIKNSSPSPAPQVRLSLEGQDGEVLAQETLAQDVSSEWQKFCLTLTPLSTQSAPGESAGKVRLVLEMGSGSLDFDMISLMPSDTYKGLPVRKDLGEMLEALHPSFLRFPGGCVIEGRDEESMYSWKDSIGGGKALTLGDETSVGDVALRPQGMSIWRGNSTHPYYTSYGIGFFEFFELCEALDCLPVPVLNAGMTCQVQSPKYIVYPVSSPEFQQLVQDALDLVEFCRGDASTQWGSVRIAMGHEEPFPLKYIGIGNEQWQTEYFEHYREFASAFSEAARENPALYGDIRLIVANGPSSGDRVGWNYVEDCIDWGDEVTALVDEHYYEAPSFFFSNTGRYDSYERDGQAKVFLGEYAAQSNTLEAALAEAAYMTGLEKNADVVEMACYAPLFGNRLANQWTPDLIWYGSDTVYGSVNYYVQQLFGANTGTLHLPGELTVSASGAESGLCGAVGLGTWQTSAAFDNLTVTDNATGEVLYSNDFEDPEALKAPEITLHEGNWSLSEGRLVQTNTGAPFDANTGDALFLGDPSWHDYTLTVEAEILEGAEGFLIPVCVEDSSNLIFWNVGGWGNTLSCLQIVSGNSKSGQITGTVHEMKLKHNQVYQVKMVVSGDRIQGYINDMQYLDYTRQAPQALYESASRDENGDLILKLVNTTGERGNLEITLEDFDPAAYEPQALATVLSGSALGDVNSFDEPEKMTPSEGSVPIGESFSYEAPAYSVSILRIRKK